VPYLHIAHIMGKVREGMPKEPERFGPQILPSEFQIASDWMPAGTDVCRGNYSTYYACLSLRASPSYSYPLFVLVRWTIPFAFTVHFFNVR